MPSKLERYFVKEVLKGTLSTFVAVALLVAVAILYQYWRDGNTSVLLEILGYSLPKVFTFALPVSFFAGIVLAVGKISSSGEMIIIRASGVSMARLYVPILLLAILFSTVLFVTWDRLVPGGEGKIEELVKTVAFDALKRVNPNEKQRVVFNDMTITLSPDNEGGIAVRIIIEDESGSRFINADNCNIEIVKDGRIALVTLNNGFISGISDVNYPRTNFDSLSFEIPGPGVKDPKPYLDRKRLSLKNMHAEAFNILELAASAETEKQKAGYERLHRRYLSFLHYIVASAIAPIFLMLVAIPLGLLLSFGNRAIGIGAALVYVFVVFYPLLLGGRFFADSGSAPAWIVMQSPNIASAILGFFLLRVVKK